MMKLVNLQKGVNPATSVFLLCQNQVNEYIIA